MNTTIQPRLLTLAPFILLTLVTAPLSAADNDVVATALAALPVHRGWAVILGGTAEQVMALTVNSEFTVLAQMSDAKETEKLRQAALDRQWLGIRLFVETGVEKCVLADNLADLAIALDKKTSESEVLRVISPRRGRGYVDGKVITKPAPPGSDEWTHRYHAADNNPASSDTAFQLPAMLQYLATPSWRSGWEPAIQLAGDGIMITVTVPTLTIGNWRFRAHSLYNGTTLWQRDVVWGGSEFWPTAPLYALYDKHFYLAASNAAAVTVIDSETGKDVATIAPTVPETQRVYWLGIENRRLGMWFGKLVPPTPEQKQKNKATSGMTGCIPGGENTLVTLLCG